MDYVRLGRSDLLVSRTAFGAMSLEKAGTPDGVAALVHKAYDAGVNFFDTARSCPDSEKLLGAALYTIRQNVIIATKTTASCGQDVYRDLEASLNAMHIESIELYQYGTDGFLPENNGSDGIYAALTALKSAGKIKHIGIVTQDFNTARHAVQSKLYETLQYPFCMVSGLETIELVKLCADTDTGFIAMQPLCGGVLSNIPLAFGFLYQYENVIPLWGVLKQEELDQILYFNNHPPVIDDKFKEDVEKLRQFFN
jgi:uncharacterized protein